tara:strand:+ start:3148 stop:3774 length:627 start_codon:yes stop_codon:yes gene_type:complete
MVINKIKNLFKSRLSVEDSIPKISLEKKHMQNCELLLNREELLDKIPKNSILAEIGVDEGDFSERLYKKCDPEYLYLIDLWSSKRYGEKKFNIVKNRFYDQLKKDEVKIFRDDSISVVSNFNDNFFDWIYIDTDHSFNTTYKELITWKSKVKRNGIISGHDYMMGNWKKTYRYGVIEAVHKFCVEYSWEMVFLTIDQTENLSFAIKRI